MNNILWSVLLCGLTCVAVRASDVSLSPVHYDLDVAVDFDQEVLKATARIDVQNIDSVDVKEASLLLHRLLRVTSIRDADGERLPFTQTVSAFDDFSRLQVNRVLVNLPKALSAGDRTVLALEYEGHLVGYAETGMLYVQDRIDREFTILRDDAYAHPRFGGLSFQQNRSLPEASYTYSARIRVPDAFFVANGGRLEKTNRLEGTVAFHYASLKPSWRMDFAIAKYAEHVVGPIRVLYFPADAVGAMNVAQAAEQSIALLTRWFGPRASDATLTFIEIPDGWGSQTDVTTIIQSASAFKDSARMHEVYHEVSHLWNVPALERPSPRWNEGLATFLEYLIADALEDSHEVEARTNRVIDWLGASLATHEAWKETPLIDYGSQGMTDLSYSVGAVYFHLLYRLIGCEAFNRSVANYIAKYHAGGSIREFLSVAQAETKLDLTPLNDDWLFTTNWFQRLAATTNVEALDAHYRRIAQQAEPSPPR